MLEEKELKLYSGGFLYTTYPLPQILWSLFTGYVSLSSAEKLARNLEQIRGKPEKFRENNKVLLGSYECIRYGSI